MIGNAGDANVLVSTGGAITTIAAMAGVPSIVSFEVSGLVTLLFRPGVFAVIAMVILQVPLAAKAPPEKVTIVVVNVIVPPQNGPVNGTIVNPGGRVSVNARPVKVVVFIFLRLMPILKVPFKGTVVPAKFFVITGASIAAPGRHGLVMLFPYCAAFPKLFVSPALSFPKLKTQLVPVPIWLQNV